MEDKIIKTIENFKKNGFDVKWFDLGVDAAKWLSDQVEAEQQVGFGGSITLRQIELKERLLERKVNVIDHWAPGLTAEEAGKLFRKVFSADAYFTSANAITEDGYILNIDGNGNRVAASIFGPQKVYFVVGINKLVPNTDAAFDRAEQSAVQNAERLNKDTPCRITGKCEDCNSSQRICRAYVLSKRPTTSTPTTVVLIGENLGY